MSSKKNIWQTVLPPPFSWAEIPDGEVELESGHGKLFVEEFCIAKYPITNAQFQVFIDDTNQYKDTKWWDYSKYASDWLKENPHPRSTAFEGDDYPRTNVNWFEAMAFCQWLSARVGGEITLPTEQQWQRAAQGNDGRLYPWGNTWDQSRCQNSVGGGWGSSGGVTSVTHYEGKGNSPYNVVDMSGNVSELCLNDYETGSVDVRKPFEYRVLRGAAWFVNDKESFRVTSRIMADPDGYDSFRGFRPVYTTLWVQDPA